MNTIKAIPTNINNTYDYVFIGCGLSTATVCAKLPKNKKVLIIEKEIILVEMFMIIKKMIF